MTGLIRRFWAVFGLLVWMMSQPLSAQDRATLVADTLSLTGQDRLVATGNVEVFYQGTRLIAHKIVYDQALQRLEIEGPIRLDDGKTVTILASAALLRDDLTEGLITSAQVIIDQQLQLTSGAMQRVAGRYNTMQNVAASSCKICAGSAAPLWEIRAQRVVHDTAEKQLYFNNAQFRFGGVPLVYFPRLRLADPSLKRATGFLIPRIEANSSLGVGVKIPYFVTLGPDRDVTITPYATTAGSRSLDLRYRQVFRTGAITVNTALTQDSVLAGQLRGYLLASGQFSLGKDYTMRFRAETVSDSSYFRGYGLTEKDRLVTSIDVQRARRDTYIKGRLLGFYSVRASDDNVTQPSQIADFERQQRIDMGQFGEANVTLYANARQRASNNIYDGTDPDTSADGRDVLGFGLRGTWQKSAILPFGLVLNGTLVASADSYRVEQDAVYAGQYTRRTAAFATELRWPMLKLGRSGGLHTLEPIAQLVLAPSEADRLFNEDSALVEFDEGNLFAINRFPGSDRIETGNRANIGVNYTYSGIQGQRAQLTLGRVFSTTTASQFSAASGLGQARSDWLIAGQLDMNSQFGFTARSLVTEQGALRKVEFRGAITGQDSGFSLGYLFAPADALEERSSDISEISLFTTQKLSSNWKGSLSSRYNTSTDKIAKAGLGLIYRNECLLIDVSLSRSFISSSTVSPSTDFGLSMALLGFGGQAAGVAAQCGG